VVLAVSETTALGGFCADHPNGTYVVSTGSHVVAVVDGDYYDTSDTGSEIPIAYFEKEAML
jgi:hypothetical protein